MRFTIFESYCELNTNNGVMKIGELVLFPTLRKQTDEVIIAAPGTSCRHQVKDGTGKNALHPVEVLWDALV